VLPSYRRGNYDKKHPSLSTSLLDTLNNQGHITYTPSRILNEKLIVPYGNCFFIFILNFLSFSILLLKDDRFIIKASIYHNAIIVSNDKYRDLCKENIEWKKHIENNLLQYIFMGDHFDVPQDPFGRKFVFLYKFFKIKRERPNPNPILSSSRIWRNLKV